MLTDCLFFIGEKVKIMTDVIFKKMAKIFEDNGRVIEKIYSKSSILFSISPFSGSFLGWDRVTLSHFTLFDCIPLADLSEDELDSGSKKIHFIVREAIEALKIEETNMKRLKRRSLFVTHKPNQMLWL